RGPGCGPDRDGLAPPGRAARTADRGHRPCSRAPDRNPDPDHRAKPGGLSHMHIESSARVGDVMTRDVITASPATPFKHLVAAMVEHHVSALPVVDAEGRVVGVVSEADLLRREEHADPEGGRFVLDSRRRRAERARAQALTAGELM